MDVNAPSILLCPVKEGGICLNLTENKRKQTEMEKKTDLQSMFMVKYLLNCPKMRLNKWS